MNRRSLLLTPPAVAVATLLPVASPAAVEPAETPVLALFRQWRDLFQLANRTDILDEVGDKAGDDLLAVEEAMLAEPCTCLADFAAKVYADTSGGDFFASKALIAEAEALIRARV